MKTNKTLYFEGAGCVARGDVPNCRIRTAFHLDDGRAIYLEISGMETTRCSAPMYRKFRNYGIINHLHFANCSAGDDRCEFGIDRSYAFEYSLANILSLVNSLGASFEAVEVLPDLAGYRVHAENGGYNFADSFALDCDLLAARQSIDSHIREKEIARGEKSICYSLWVDSEDPAILHYKNYRTGEQLDICVAAPKNPDKLPTLHKSNAIPGALYAGAGYGVQYLHRVYRITEEYAERYNLMYLDRCETSVGDFALPGSDIYRRKASRNYGR
jgi:hypothetical protein